MKTNLKFNSAICTSREQSERLLALGLKKETADMFYSHDKGEDIYAIRACWGDFWDSNKLIDGHIRRHCIPAWSLHRLMEIIPSEIHIEDYYLILGVSFDCVYYADNEYAEVFQSFEGTAYSCIIKCIEWLIKEGYFNKEYLERIQELWKNGEILKGMKGYTK